MLTHFTHTQISNPRTLTVTNPHEKLYFPEDVLILSNDVWGLAIHSLKSSTWKQTRTPEHTLVYFFLTPPPHMITSSMLLCHPMIPPLSQSNPPSASMGVRWAVVLVRNRRYSTMLHSQYNYRHEIKHAGSPCSCRLHPRMCCFSIIQRKLSELIKRWCSLYASGYRILLKTIYIMTLVVDNTSLTSCKSVLV